MITQSLFGAVDSLFDHDDLDPLAAAWLAEQRASDRLALLQRTLTGATERLYRAELQCTRSALLGRGNPTEGLVLTLREQVAYLTLQVAGARLDLKWAEASRRQLERAA
jgi:hypothetical protein